MLGCTPAVCYCVQTGRGRECVTLSCASGGGKSECMWQSTPRARHELSSAAVVRLRGIATHAVRAHTQNVCALRVP